MRNDQERHILKSALVPSHVVQTKIIAELAAGRTAGPLSVSSYPDLKILHLGVVPKRQAGQFRFIHHLSHSRSSCQSVNDGI